MAWNQSSGESAKPTPKKPSALKGVIAGVIVVVAAIGAALFLMSGRDVKPKAKAEKESGLIKEVKPAAAPTNRVAQAVEKKTETKEGKPDTNIVWISKMRYVKKMANGASVMVFVDDPDAPKPVPIFENGLNNFLTNFTTPGEDVPETPMEVSNDEVMQALMEKIEIKDDDSDEVKFQKEAVKVLREELRKYIKEGNTAADFIRDIQRRQQMEAEHVREARGMIMEALSKENPAQARELYNAINKHMNEKGLPKVRLARKFLKMMEATE